MTPEERLALAKERLYAAVHHEKPDRTPILFSSGIAVAKYYNPSIVIADTVERPYWVAEQAMCGLEKLKYVDGMNQICQAPNNAQASFWMARMKQPGVELDRDELWQIDEVALMTDEDYDTVLNEGWKCFFDDYMARVGTTAEDFEKGMQAAIYGDTLLRQHGYINCPDGMFLPTYDLLCAGRGMLNFAKDLRKKRDTVKAALDVLLEYSLADFKKMAAEHVPEIIFVQPGVRANSDFLSRERFEELVFPHFKAMADYALELGSLVYFHMDGNWDDALDLFTEFPRHRCIFDSDGLTNIYKIKEILGDRMAITGNLSASLLSVGNPDDVYAEAKTLIEDMGRGFIMAPACSLPPNIKPECLEAMVAACVE